MIKRERWTEDDVCALPAGEHDDLERKGSSWLKDPGFRGALSKAVSALANSGGGRLIIGIEDDGDIRGVNPVWKGRESTRDWLEKLIPESVRPVLTGFRVHDVEPMTPSVIPHGKVLIIAEIPDSLAAPHQAEPERVYYVRQGARSVHAPHHILEALRSRFVGAILVPSLKELVPRKKRGLNKFEGSLVFTVKNEGRVAAYRWALTIGIKGVPVERQADVALFRESSDNIEIADRAILPSLAAEVRHGIRFQLQPEGHSQADLEDDLLYLLKDAVIVFTPVSETDAGQPIESRLLDRVSLDSFWKPFT